MIKFTRARKSDGKLLAHGVLDPDDDIVPYVEPILGIIHVKSCSISYQREIVHFEKV